MAISRANIGKQLTNRGKNKMAVKKMKKAFHTRRDLIVSRLNTMDNIECSVPKGAFYVFPNISIFTVYCYYSKLLILYTHIY